MNALEDIRGGSQIHPWINTGDARFKICDRIRPTQNEWKVVELSAKSMGKVLHKVSNSVFNELNNALPDLVESGSEVSHMSKSFGWNQLWNRSKFVQQSEFSNGLPR